MHFGKDNWKEKQFSFRREKTPWFQQISQPRTAELSLPVWALTVAISD